MKDDITEVNCDYCGNSMKCPSDMLSKVKKYMCSNCFEDKPDLLLKEEIGNVHVDISSDDALDRVVPILVQGLTEELFPGFWKDFKEKSKDRSKRETAQDAFAAGAGSMLYNFVSLLEAYPNLKKKDK